MDVYEKSLEMTYKRTRRSRGPYTVYLYKIFGRCPQSKRSKRKILKTGRRTNGIEHSDGPVETI